MVFTGQKTQPTVSKYNRHKNKNKAQVFCELNSVAKFWQRES